MKKHLKFKKRWFFSLAAIILVFTIVSPLSIFAAEPVDESELALEAAGVTREEAIEMFGLTEEQAENVTFYLIDESSSSSNQSRGVVVDPENPWKPSRFHFTGYNGGSYNTMNGENLIFRVLWKPDPGDGSEFCKVHLYAWGSYSPVYSVLLTLASPVYIYDTSFRDITSSSIDITYGLDYRFVYESYTGHGGMYPTDHGSTIQILVAVF